MGPVLWMICLVGGGCGGPSESPPLKGSGPGESSTSTVTLTQTGTPTTTTSGGTTSGACALDVEVRTFISPPRESFGPAIEDGLGGSYFSANIDEDLTLDGIELLATGVNQNVGVLGLMDAQRDVVWAQTFPTPEYSSVWDVVRLDDGTVVVAIGFRDTVTVGGEVFTSLGDLDTVVATLDSQGTVLDTLHVQGPGDDRVRDLAAMPDGRIGLGGIRYDQLVVGAGQPGEVTLELGPNEVLGAWIAVVDADLQVVWVEEYGKSESALLNDLVADPLTGDLMVAGSGSGRSDLLFNPGQPTELALNPQDYVADPVVTTATSTTSTGTATNLPTAYVGFVARYASDGTIVEVQPQAATPGSLVVEPSGAVAVAGGFWAAARFGFGETWETTLSSTESEAYVMRLDVLGALDWINQTHSASGGYTFGGDVVAHDDGLLLTSYFVEGVDFDDTGAHALQAVGEGDGFLVRYDTQGQVVCSLQLGGMYTDSIRAVIPLGAGRYRMLADVSAGAALIDGTTLHMASALGDGDLAVFDLTL